MAFRCSHFPAADTDSFVHGHTTPYGLGASFCPECFHEQIATKKPLHLKAESPLRTIRTKSSLRA